MPTPYKMPEEERQRIVSDALSQFKVLAPETLTPQAFVIERAKAIVKDVVPQSAQFAREARAAGCFDEHVFREELTSRLLDRFREFQYDELLFLVVNMQVEFIKDCLE